MDEARHTPKVERPGFNRIMHPLSVPNQHGEAWFDKYKRQVQEGTVAELEAEWAQVKKDGGIWMPTSEPIPDFPPSAPLPSEDVAEAELEASGTAENEIPTGR